MPQSDVEVHWGDANFAKGAVTVSGNRWTGDPLAGIYYGPALLAPEHVSDGASIEMEMLFRRVSGVAQLLRWRGLGNGYRAVVLHDPDTSNHLLEDISLEDGVVTFNRVIRRDFIQEYTGVLDSERGTLSGSFISRGVTYRFAGRRRIAAGADELSGEWLLNANGYWIRVDITVDSDGVYGGTSFVTTMGGHTVLIERWAEGIRTVFGSAVCPCCKYHAESLVKNALLCQWKCASVRDGRYSSFGND